MSSRAQTTSGEKTLRMLPVLNPLFVSLRSRLVGPKS